MKSKVKSGWRTVKLGEVCELNPRRPKLDRATSAPTTFVQMSAVAENGGGIVRPETRPFGQVAKGYTFFAEGDVIFAKITPCMQNGKHAIAGNLLDGIGFGSTEFHVFRPGGEIISEWILNFLLQPKISAEASRHFTGAVGQQRVPENVLANMEIELPPVREQRRIAGRLREQMAAVERARAAVEQQLDAAQKLPAALLRAVFTSPAAQRWPRKPFGDLVENFDGVRIPLKHTDRNKRAGKYPYYGASGIIDQIDSFLFDGEFLLIGEDGANLLSRSTPIAFRAKGKFWVNNHAHVVQPKSGIRIEWLEHFFAATDLQPFVTGSAQPKLSQGSLNGIPVSVPPPDEQNNLVARLDAELTAARALVETLETRLAEIELLPAALLRSAFGENKK